MLSELLRSVRLSGERIVAYAPPRTFSVGFVLMILVHELGHALEARRQGLQVSAPTFIPFLGAYVTIRHAGLSPWRNARISLATASRAYVLEVGSVALEGPSGELASRDAVRRSYLGY